MSRTATQILSELSAGDPAAADRLLPLVYGELRALAAHHLGNERVGHTLQPTALVHEAYLRMIKVTEVDWENERHFLAVAAEAIRRVLVDHARGRRAAKRGGDWQRLTLDPAIASIEGRGIDVEALDVALARLAAVNPRQARIVELRFFGGLREEDIAELEGVSRTTIANQWSFAKAWLSRELSGELS